jgi:hypothetical protein
MPATLTAGLVGWSASNWSSGETQVRLTATDGLDRTGSAGAGTGHPTRRSRATWPPSSGSKAYLAADSASTHRALGDSGWNGGQYVEGYAPAKADDGNGPDGSADEWGPSCGDRKAMRGRAATTAPATEETE